MGVYFEPRSPQWYDYVAPVAAHLLGGVIDNQFAKSKEKRTFQMEQDKAAAEEARTRARIDDFHNYYGDAAFDVRGNPSGFMENMMGANLWGIDPATIKTAAEAGAPPMTFQSIDRGDTVTAGMADPATGDFYGQDYGVNLSPDTKAVTETQRYGYDSDMARTLAEIQGRKDAARISAAGVNQQPAMQQFIDRNGRLYYVDPQTGNKVDTGLLGPETTPQAPKPFRIVQDKAGNNVMVYNDATSSDLGIQSAPKSSGGDAFESIAGLIGSEPPKQESNWNAFKKFFGFGGTEDVIIPGDPIDAAVKEFESAARSAGTSANPFAERGVSDAAYRAAIASGMTDEEIEEQLTAAGR
jgi:hypothetical protein